VDAAIAENVRIKTTPQVGVHFMKFCGKYELTKISEQADAYAKSVNAPIAENVRIKTTPQVGVHFMKFCGKYELTKISEQADAYAKWLNAPYTGVLA